jgi:hypothetical protein
VNAAAPVSAGLLANRDGDVAALTAYREGAPDPIVIVARAVLVALQNGRALVEPSRAVRARWAELLGDVRSDSAACPLADGLIQQHVIAAHEAGLILGRQTNLHRHINTLIEHDIIKPHRDYRTRNMTWRVQEVLDLLDEYAEHAGRRRH